MILKRGMPWPVMGTRIYGLLLRPANMNIFISRYAGVPMVYDMRDIEDTLWRPVMGNRMDWSLQWFPVGSGCHLNLAGLPYFGDTEELYWDALAWLEER